MDPIHVRRLGRTRYEAAHALQQELLAARLDGAIGDTLLLTEHERVVTLGRGSPRGAEGATALPVVPVERGGEATWHGPGQLVAYPILLLPEAQRDLHRYLRDLEEVVIGVLASFGVEGARVEGKTGVWIGGLKVCSIGVAVRRWVTWHGLALNVDNDLADFRAFAPCGLDPNVMTRLSDHAQGVTLAATERALLASFARTFGREWVEEP
ncbi:MAG: lipoyl(octanoyl) transferase LipB [Planctomycetes bacterium]|nr:lipoyl(octanoyl) transferase LipB [Planctomycetota bacterium]